MSEKKQPVQDSIKHSPFNALLNLEVLEVKEDQLRARLPYQEVFRAGSESRGWYIHGGIIASFIDVVGDFVFVPSIGQPLPTIDLRIDYLRPALPKDLFAEANIVKKGRSLGWSDIVITDEQKRIIAVGRGVYSTKI